VYCALTATKRSTTPWKSFIWTILVFSLILSVVFSRLACHWDTSFLEILLTPS
jgi:hypothetical protein